MSLTSILSDKDNQHIRDKFKSEFKHPSIKLEANLLVPPLTNNYGIIGTAFDYLVRFYLEKKNNTKIETNKWVSENVLSYLNAVLINKPSKLVSINGNMYPKKELIQKAQLNMTIAKVSHYQYLKDGLLTDNLVNSSIFLANLDLIKRVGNVSWILEAVFTEPNGSDIEDLKSLFNLLYTQNFDASDICYLNPTFGKGSLIVGGADADFILDNTLIDVKVTKNLKLTRDYINQLLGYYILSLIGGINKSNNKDKIQNIGIYFARHGFLWKAPLSSFGDEKKFNEFKEWFVSILKNESDSMSLG
jgi:hypothetical protein